MMKVECLHSAEALYTKMCGKRCKLSLLTKTQMFANSTRRAPERLLLWRMSVCKDIMAAQAIGKVPAQYTILKRENPQGGV